MNEYVYRIQDADGRGPWKPGFSDCWVEDKPEEVYAKLKPWPLEFGLEILDKVCTWEHIGCGCLTPDQLRLWFTPTEYARLKKFGYHCVQFKPSRILAQSSIQCVFTRSKALNKNVIEFSLYGEAQL